MDLRREGKGKGSQKGDSKGKGVKERKEDGEGKE